MTKEDLILVLMREGYLKTSLIIEAFGAIDRKDFVPDEIKDEAYFDGALPIDYGQTISQPLVVAFMLELLAPEPGEKILDIGSGSGWTSTLLAYIVSKKPGGKVFAIERIPELKEFGEKNCAKYNFVEKGIAAFSAEDGSKGLLKEAPFDRILAGASASRDIPDAWREELKIGGRIVAPIGNSIFLFEKKSATEFEEKEFPGFAFVPLIED